MSACEGKQARAFVFYCSVKEPESSVEDAQRRLWATVAKSVAHNAGEGIGEGGSHHQWTVFYAFPGTWYDLPPSYMSADAALGESPKPF
jgi:hypothetical protein